MYIPHRKRRKIGAALLQLDRMQLLLMGLLLLVAILFITAFMQEKMGNFTINLNRLELYRKGISISRPEISRTQRQGLPQVRCRMPPIFPSRIFQTIWMKKRETITARTTWRTPITCETQARRILATRQGSLWTPVPRARRMRFEWQSGGTEPAWYMRSLQQTEATKAAAPALSPKIWFVHMKSPISFVGNVDRYTIAIWMEGDDPECVDSIIGGSVSSACILMLTMTMRQALYGSSSQISRIP